MLRLLFFSKKMTKFAHTNLFFYFPSRLFKKYLRIFDYNCCAHICGEGNPVKRDILYNTATSYSIFPPKLLSQKMGVGQGKFE